LYDQGIPDQQRDLLVNLYFSGGYLLDPFCQAVEEGLDQGFYPLVDIAPDDFYQSEYYRQYYFNVGLVDDAYFIVDLGDNGKLSCALWRSHQAGRYHGDDLARLTAIEPVVREALLCFWRQQVRVGRIGDASNPGMRKRLEAAFINFGSSLLTGREQQMNHLILRGHSAKSAAKKLNISPDTVYLHRKNLYRKLNITSQPELFSLFFNVLACAGEDLSEDPLERYLQRAAHTGDDTVQ
jgi:DNA-binding CsgD family transcriptional regulator